MGVIAAAFLTTLLGGVPIAFVLGIAGAAHIIAGDGATLSMLPQRIFAGLDQFVLMSIPFFILAGFLMNEARLTERLIQLADHLVGHWRGGLAQVNVLTSMFFGGITGAATADTAAVGSILIPVMVKQGYRRDFAAAVTIAASICGPLIPPSIPMLVYGISSGASIGALFLAGATPGVAVGLGMLALNRWLLRDRPPDLPVKAEESAADRFRGFMLSLRTALLALAMPVLIVGGVVGGVFTPTESSVAAVLYAMAVGLSMRTLAVRTMWRLIVETAIVSATVMLIIACANLLGWVLAFEQAPQAIAAAFLGVTHSPPMFLFLVMVLLLIVGLFLETSGAIIILTPVLWPAAQAYGFDSVHFGVVMVFGLVIGLITPPVGLCLFVACSIADLKLHVLARAVVPQLVLLVAIYAIFVFVPEASLWLPHLFGF
jgi:tripartite ATP-independent transporter DctM subunit